MFVISDIVMIKYQVSFHIYISVCSFVVGTNEMSRNCAYKTFTGMNQLRHFQLKMVTMCVPNIYI